VIAGIERKQIEDLYYGYIKLSVPPNRGWVACFFINPLFS
jgi:hypothetical protein